MRQKLLYAVALVGFSVAAIAGCSCNSDSGGPGGVSRINGAGSTFVFPMMSTWADEYNKAKHVEVNYQSIGSGGGIQQMTSKTVDFGCSDAFMNEEQLEKAKSSGGEVIHIPLVMGAVVPAYTLKNVKETLVFSGPVLADIYLGKIKKWNDKAIKDLNPSVSLPDLDIAVVHRSDGSGTTAIWSDYLSKVSDEWKDKVGKGTSLNWPVGIGQKGNEAVARQVHDTEGAIGYIELTYALQTKIAFASVKNKAGKTIQASLETVTAAADSSLKDIPEDLRYSITDAPGDNAYPISGTVWAVIYVKQSKDKGKAVVDFLRWCTHEGQEFCASLQYSRLPKGLIERVERKTDSVKYE
ncbi:MAG TPA: phosphate ABC transporter substrate-binding protein PstS [Gemmataceae bacterium]|nr:phosphate ABC transporter substrate-binding protein PstS [Gemmataceae bacterium]